MGRKRKHESLDRNKHTLVLSDDAERVYKHIKKRMLGKFNFSEWASLKLLQEFRNTKETFLLDQIKVLSNEKEQIVAEYDYRLKAAAMQLRELQGKKKQEKLESFLEASNGSK